MPGQAARAGRGGRSRPPGNPVTPTPSLTKQVAKGLDDDAATAAASPAKAATPASRRGQNVAENAQAVTPGRVTRRRKGAL